MAKLNSFFTDRPGLYESLQEKQKKERESLKSSGAKIAETYTPKTEPVTPVSPTMPSQQGSVLDRLRDTQPTTFQPTGTGNMKLNTSLLTGYQEQLKTGSGTSKAHEALRGLAEYTTKTASSEQVEQGLSDFGKKLEEGAKKLDQLASKVQANNSEENVRAYNAAREEYLDNLAYYNGFVKRYHTLQDERLRSLEEQAAELGRQRDQAKSDWENQKLWEREGYTGAAGHPNAKYASEKEAREVYYSLDSQYGAATGQYYDLENQLKLSRIRSDADASDHYKKAKDFQTDIDKVLAVMGEEQTNSGDAYGANAERMLKEKYGTVDMAALLGQLKAKQAEHVEALEKMGYDYDRLTQYEQTQRDALSYEARRQEWEDYAKKHGVAASVTSVLHSPFQGLDYAGALLGNIGHNDESDLGSYVPLNRYNMDVTNYVQTLRQTVGEEIAADFDNKTLGNAFKFLYDTGMSIADSATQVATFGSASIYFMGASAASATAADVLERGGTNGQALASGLAAGAAEAIFERFSVEQLLKSKDIYSVKVLLQETAKQAGTEASEEIFTEIANILSDIVIMRGDSNYEQAVRKAMSDGNMSRTEAEKAVFMEKLGEVALAGVGGAISGGVMGGFHGSVQYQQNRNSVDSLVELLTKNLDTPIDVPAAAEYTEDSKTAAQPTEVRKNGEQNGAQVQKTENAESPDTTAFLEIGMTLPKARKMAATVEKLRTGAELTGGEVNSLISSGKLVRQTIGELTGVTFPEGKLSQEKLMELFISAKDIAAQRAVEAVDMGGAVDADAQLQDAQLQAELTERLDRLEGAAVESAAVEEEDLDTYGKPLADEATFAEMFRAVNPAATPEETAAVYQQYRSDEASIEYGGQRLSRKGFMEFVKNNFPAEGRPSDTELETMFTTLLTQQRSDRQSVKVSEEVHKAAKEWERALQKAGAVKHIVFDDTLSHNENAYYDRATGELHINPRKVQDADTLAYVLGHELIHAIKDAGERRAFVKDIIRTLAPRQGEGFDLDLEIADVQRTYQKHENALAKKQNRKPEKISFEDAEEEVAADLMSTVFRDGDMMRRFAETDPTGFQKVIDWLWHLLETVFPKQTKAHQETERLRNKMVEMLKDTQLTEDADGVVTNSAGDAVAAVSDDGSRVNFSLSTYDEEGRAYLQKWLKKAVKQKRLTQQEATDILEQLDGIYDICNQFKDAYAPFGEWSDAKIVSDSKGNPVFSVVKANGEYAMNLDFSLVCKKRRTLDAVFNQMVKEGLLDEFNFDQEEIVLINDIIREHGFETACALCFVDSKRFRQGKVSTDFVLKYNRLVMSLVPKGSNMKAAFFNFGHNETLPVIENGVDTVADDQLDWGTIDAIIENLPEKKSSYTVEDKIALHLKSTPADRKLTHMGDFMSTRGFDAAQAVNPEVMKLYNSAKGSGGPKAAFSDVQYLGDILKRSRTFNVDKAYVGGGVRIQSFSDYVPRMVFDYAQMIGDLAAMHLPAHAYTKEELFVRQFGLTGIKINMSLIPAVVEGGVAPGLGAEGNYVWADESFDFDTALEIQNAEGYSRNCGTIAVGVSDEHIRTLLADPNIRMVIPYHKSGLNPIVAHMNKIDAFEDYTDSQNTRYENGTKLNEKDTKSFKFDFNAEMRKLGDPRATAEAYVRLCEENGYLPKFDQFAYAERDGQAVYDDSGQRMVDENYYKLLVDFSVYDNGVYTPQEGVTMTFPTEDSAFGSMKDLIQRGLEEDALLEAKRDKEVPIVVQEVVEKLRKWEGGERRYSLDDFEDSDDPTTALNIPAEVIYGARYSELHDSGDIEDYDKAKRGDVDAAVRLISKYVTADAVAKIAAFGKHVYLLPVQGVEGQSDNILPEAISSYISKATDQPILGGIFQAKKLNRRGQDHDTRLTSPDVVFDISDESVYNILKGAEVVVIDDNTSYGSTLRGIAKFLQDNDAKMVGSYVLTVGGDNSEALIVTDETWKAIEKEGIENVKQYAREHGYTDAFTREQLGERRARDFLREYKAHKRRGQSTDRAEQGVRPKIHGTSGGAGYASGALPRAENQVTTKSKASVDSGAFSSGHIRYSLDREADYRAAVESGDIAAAQKMVDEAAKKAGYDKKVYHGTDGDFTVFDTTARGEAAEAYASHRWANAYTPGTIFMADTRRTAGAYGSRIMPLYLNTEGMKVFKHKNMDAHEAMDTLHLGDVMNYPVIAVVGKDQTLYATRGNTRVKSTEPVLYDDNGEMIPLSKRFDSGKSDIRYSLDNLDPDLESWYRSFFDNPDDADAALDVVRRYSKLLEKYGTMEESAEAVREAPVPKKNAPTKQVSQTVRTVMGAEATPNSRIPTIMEAVVDGKLAHEPLPNEPLVNRALNKLKHGNFNTLLAQWTADVRSGKSSPELVAMGAVLYHAAANSDMTGEQYLDLVSDYVDLMSRAGQSLQAGRILQRLTPEGKLYTAQKTADKIEEKLRGRQNRKQREAEDKALDQIVDVRDTALQTITDIFEALSEGRKRTRDNIPVEDWMTEVGNRLAEQISRGMQDKRTRQNPITRTIQQDLLKFAESYALPKGRNLTTLRSAAQRLADYFANREQYAEAWKQAQTALREQYADNPAALDALEEFLQGTIDYNGVGADKVMMQAVAEIALAGDTKARDIVLRTRVGERAHIENRVFNALNAQVKAAGADEIALREAVSRYVSNLMAESGIDAEKALANDVKKAMREIGVKMQDIIRQGASSRERVAVNIADMLVRDYGVAPEGADEAARQIVAKFEEMAQASANKAMENMFKDREARKQKDLLVRFDELVNLGAFTSDRFDRLAAEKIFKVSVRIDPALIEKYRAAKTDAERDAVMDEITANVAEQIPATKMDKFTALRYLNMLGNLKTQVRNVVGNAAFQPVRMLKDGVGAVLEGMAAKAGVDIERTKSLKRDAETFAAAKQDFESVRKIIMGGGKYNDNLRFGEDIESKRRIFKNALLEKYRTLTRDVMDAGDVVFSRFTYQDAMARYMAANKLTWSTATEEQKDAARVYAIKQAAEATYRDTNAFSEMVSQMRFRNPDTWAKQAANVVGQGVLPFRKTPANILVRAIEYSPLGAVTTGLTAVQAKRGNAKASDVIDMGSKAITGSLLMLLGYLLADSGLLTGGDDDDENKAEFDALTGRQPYALEAFGKSYTLDWLAPEAVPLFMGADLAAGVAEAGELNPKVVLQTLGGVTDPLLEMSMLQGLNTTLQNAASYGTDDALVRFTGNALWSYLTQGLTSTLGGQLERAFDNERTTTYVNKESNVPEAVQRLLGQAGNKIPVVDYQQIPYVDAWGRMETNGPDNFVGNFAYQLVSPGYYSDLDVSAMEQELARLYETTGKTEVLPKRAPKYFTVNKERLDLDAVQYVEYATKRGRDSYDALTALTADSAYQSLDDAAKAKAVGQVYDAVNQMAKKSVAPDFEVDNWIDEAMNSSVGFTTYVAAKAATANAVSLKENGETIDNSKSLQIMASIYAMPGLSDKEREELFGLFANKSTKSYTKKQVTDALDAMRARAD